MKEIRILNILWMFPLLMVTVATWARSAQVSEQERIIVSAAMSLKSPLEKVGREFSKDYPGYAVDFNFGSSGSLRMQIEGGAPADVFASASVHHMDLLDKSNAIDRNSRVNFARNTVVLIVPAVTPKSITSFPDLADHGVRRVAIGNPANSPAGRYAEETLRSLGLWKDLNQRLIFCEHVRQILDYVARGEVDAGILYATDATLRAGDVRVVASAPPGVHEPIVYPAAVLRQAAESKAPGVFVKYLQSETARTILLRHGFILPE